MNIAYRFLKVNDMGSVQIKHIVISLKFYFIDTEYNKFYNNINIIDLGGL